MMPEHMGYDRAIVVFSPDGRLFQVEYAREAVKKGATALGIVFNTGVLLATIKKDSKLLKYSEKLFKVDNQIGLVASGYMADARVLVDVARVKAQQHKMLFDEPISVFGTAKFLADRHQMYTQHAGVRPYGVSWLIGGIDKKPELYETDPSGVLLECIAQAVGRSAPKINKMFETKIKGELNKKQAIQLAITALKEEEKVSADRIAISVIEEGQEYKELDVQDLEKMGIKV